MVDVKKVYGTVVREGVDRACKEFSTSIAPLGFARTKAKLWTRQRDHQVEFIHLFRSGSSYGAPSGGRVEFRVNSGIRVLNDTFAALHLNGPISNDGRFWDRRLHLRFNAETGSTYERCQTDLFRFVTEQLDPWFLQFSNSQMLLDHPETPLSESSRVALTAAALHGSSNPELVTASLKLLGIKKHRPPD